MPNIYRTNHQINARRCEAIEKMLGSIFVLFFGFCVFASIGWWSDCIISIDGVCMCRPAASDGILWCTNRTQWSIPIHAAAITAMRAKNATHTTGLDWRRNGMALYASNMFFYVRLNGIISIKARADEWNIIINTYAQRHCSITSHTHTYHMTQTQTHAGDSFCSATWTSSVPLNWLSVYNTEYNKLCAICYVREFARVACALCTHISSPIRMCVCVHCTTAER